MRIVSLLIGLLLFSTSLEAGTLTGNDKRKDQGIIKIHDGVEFVDVTDSGALKVDETKGFISTNNSSTATLAGDAIFTGTADNVSQFASVSILYNRM